MNQHIRVKQNAIIGLQLIDFDFIIGDTAQEINGSRRGIITAVQNPTVTIKWCDSNKKETVTVDKVERMK